jgi:hypothetical protein
MTILGLGWVTPLGRDLATVWRAIRAGEAASTTALESPFTHRSFPVRRVDPKLVEDVARQPRLRRSSLISHFAVAAALDAVRDSALQPDPARLGLVFATTNGGVIYTRRFFEGIAQSGAHAGSPLLFPETVYNAPASHVAAALGITGEIETLVNDATAGIDALATAADLLAIGACDHCLVVAADEADWAICEGHRTWKIAPIFAEGACALLLGRDGSGPGIREIFRTAPPSSSASRREWFVSSASQIETIEGSAGLGKPISRRGPEVLAPPRSALDAVFTGLWPQSHHLAPKACLGEAFAAGALTQVACAALALRENGGRALVPVAGQHGQTAAVTLTR